MFCILNTEKTIFQIADRNQSNKIYFDNQRRKSNLGYIVKNEFILDSIYKNLEKQKSVKIFNNISLKDIFYEGSRIITKQDNFLINTNLLVASDGKNSLVRNIFKTPIFSKDYKKKAIVINFYHSKSHQNTAYEFFFKNGPLAILPMQKNKNYFQSSIVWTNTNEFINSLLLLDDGKIILKKRFFIQKKVLFTFPFFIPAKCSFFHFSKIFNFSSLLFSICQFSNIL